MKSLLLESDGMPINLREMILGSNIGANTSRKRSNRRKDPVYNNQIANLRRIMNKMSEKMRKENRQMTSQF